MAVDEALLREALASSGQQHGPGLFGLVTEDGEVAFEGSVGVADIEDPRPIRAQDQFRIGSVTNTYVAALVLKLADEGALSLADPLDRWLPGVVPGGEQITVEMLLRMRSGLPDYVGPLLGDPLDLRVLAEYWPPEELVRVALAGGERLAPDAGYRYDFAAGSAAFGHTGGMPGHTTVAMRTPAGRCVILWQNGYDQHDPLQPDTPFIRAALSQ